MSIEVAKVTIGCDPELAVYDRLSKVMQCVPAWEVVPAKKGEPPYNLKNGVTIHADGVGLEFNTKPVLLAGFIESVRDAMDQVKHYVRTTGTARGAHWDVIITPESKKEIGFSKEALAHPLANLDGCDPDYCAYNEKPATPRIRKPLAEFSQRFFGGHIHLGYDTSVVPAWALTRFLDMFVYIPVIAYDLQPVRRTIFGNAGIYRPKAYGVEYRTPGPFWLGNNTVLLNVVNNIKSVFEGFQTDPDAMNTFHNEFDWRLVQHFVDTFEAKYNSDTKAVSKEFDYDTIKTWATKLHLRSFRFLR